jgi:CheY-like chemotaxis protein
MTSHQIHPIYFPTTTILVDDSRPFLENISLQLDPQVAYGLYHSPSKALEAINSRNRIKPFRQGYFSRYSHQEEFSSNNCVIDIDVDKIHHEVYNDTRFAECSVIVVDYLMPEMTGLEFCRNITLPGVKKVLLTGRADEKLAVRAFNEGLIERFITKNDVEALATLNRVITELQDEYFYDLGGPLVDLLTSGSYGFLRDPAFIEIFSQLRSASGIVEYYLCCNPEGILLVDQAGITSLLIACVEEDMQAHYEISLDQGAPQALLDALSSRKVIPYFWKTNGYYDAGLGDWQSLLYPAQMVEGQRRYFYTIVNNPPPFASNPIVSHREYLARLDASH